MSDTLNLISWNVHYPTFARDNRFVIDTLETLGRFDVICLQEYVKGADKQMQKWLQANNYQTTFLPFSSKNNLSQGVLTATSNTLETKAHPVVLRKDPPKRRRPFPNIRGLLATSVLLGDQELTILNTHLTYARLHTCDMRSREFVRLQEFLNSESTKYPWLMCGDFNFVGLDSRRKQLTNSYHNFTGTLLNKTWRHEVKHSPIRANLDYFFWNGQDLQIEPRLAPFNMSDHRPLIAKISL